MTLDANDYRMQYEYVRGLTRGKSIQDIYYDIGAISVATTIPIIIVAAYIEEMYGKTSQLTAFTIRLMEFYQVKEVYNVRLFEASTG